MAQVSITNFYRTTRSAKAGNLKDTKNDLNVDIDVKSTQKSDQLPSERVITAKIVRARGRPETKDVAEDAPTAAVTTTTRKAPVKKTATRTRKEAKPENVPDIRSFLSLQSQVKGLKNAPKDASSTGEVSQELVAPGPTKRPSSPSAEEALLLTPKRVRRDVVQVDKDDASKKATSSSTHEAPIAVPTTIKTPKKASIADVIAKLAALKEKTNALNRRRALSPEPSADCAGAETVTIEVPAR
jgi:hypothetical protein